MWWGLPLNFWFADLKIQTLHLTFLSFLSFSFFSFFSLPTGNSTWTSNVTPVRGKFHQQRFVSPTPQTSVTTSPSAFRFDMGLNAEHQVLSLRKVLYVPLGNQSIHKIKWPKKCGLQSGLLLCRNKISSEIVGLNPGCQTWFFGRSAFFSWLRCKVAADQIYHNHNLDIETNSSNVLKSSAQIGLLFAGSAFISIYQIYFPSNITRSGWVKTLHHFGDPNLK